MKRKQPAYGPYRAFTSGGLTWNVPTPAPFTPIMLDPQAAQTAALTLCKGHFQTALVYGQQNIAISDLEGRAGKYGDRYKKSRNALFGRVWWAGIPFSTVKPAKGPVKLVWGSEAIDAEFQIESLAQMACGNNVPLSTLFEAPHVYRLSDFTFWHVSDILRWFTSGSMEDIPDKYKPAVANYVLEKLEV